MYTMLLKTSHISLYEEQERQLVFMHSNFFSKIHKGGQLLLKRQTFDSNKFLNVVKMNLGYCHYMGIDWVSKNKRRNIAVARLKNYDEIVQDYDFGVIERGSGKLKSRNDLRKCCYVEYPITLIRACRNVIDSQLDSKPVPYISPLDDTFDIENNYVRNF